MKVTSSSGIKSSSRWKCTRKFNKWPENSRKTDYRSYLEVFFCVQTVKASCQITTKKTSGFAVLQRFVFHFWKKVYFFCFQIGYIDIYCHEIVFSFVGFRDPLVVLETQRKIEVFYNRSRKTWLKLRWNCWEAQLRGKNTCFESSES